MPNATPSSVFSPKSGPPNPAPPGYGYLFGEALVKLRKPGYRINDFAALRPSEPDDRTRKSGGR